MPHSPPGRELAFRWDAQETGGWVILLGLYWINKGKNVRGHVGKRWFSFRICIAFIYCVYTCTMTSMWQSENSLQESFLSCHHVGSRGWTRVIRLGGRRLYQPETSHWAPALDSCFLLRLKYSDNLWAKRLILAHNSMLYPITVGQSQHQELSTVNSREKQTQAHVLACAQLSFPTLTPWRTSCLGNGVAHSGLGLSTSMNLIKTIPYRHTHRPTEHRQSLIETFLRWFSSVSSWHLR